MDQTRLPNIDCNNNNNNNDLSNSNNNSNINNKFNDGDSKNQRKEVIVVQSVGTKGKEAEDTWRGPEGEAGSRAWVVQVLIINSDKVYSRFSSSVLTDFLVQVFNSDKLCSRFSSSILTNFLSGFSSLCPWERHKCDIAGPVRGWEGKVSCCQVCNYLKLNHFT